MARLQQQIQSYCSSIDETIALELPLSAQSKLAESFRDIQVMKHFRAIQNLLQQDSTLIYKDETLRNFLYRTVPLNPLIPKQIDGLPCDAIVPVFDEVTDDFVEAIRSSPLPITVTRFEPNLSAYRTFLQDHAHLYENRFGANRLHGDRYFFEKTLEHFITFFLIQQCRPQDIMDIGSAGHQYANILRHSYPGARVYVQDLCFPAGTRELAKDFIQIGGSAAALPLGDASLDFVTFHCSIEHFEGDADISCLREIERVLRPGGCAVIVPLHVNAEYTIAVNPLSGPFLDEAFIDQVLLPERHQHDARIIYTDSMISRFARRYSAERLTGRLLSKLTRMSFELATIEIPDAFLAEEILSGDFFNGTYRKYIPHDRRCFLKLIKQ